MLYISCMETVNLTITIIMAAFTIAINVVRSATDVTASDI